MKHSRLTFILLLWMTLSSVALAQQKHLRVYTNDANTWEQVTAAVELLALDSTRISVAQLDSEKVFGRVDTFAVVPVDLGKTYLVKASALGYKTIIKKVTIKMSKKAPYYPLYLEMEEDTRMLQEVTVKATRIKMVVRGDTLVYNANAFKLSEGSMLDALIKQLPGAELTKDGVIKVNGRTVSSLLLDGKDFFKGDAKTALENLPAYNVDKVKVYDKAGDESRLMGQNMDDKEYVLDVNLKKEYKRGLLANIDVAGGTHDRYMTRLFAMRFTDKHRLTLTGNANNLNDTSTPGQSGDFSDMPTTSGGLRSNKTLGISYYRQGKGEDFLESSNSVTHSNSDLRTRTTSQTFLGGGDTYNLSKSSSYASSTTWSTGNTLRLSPKNAMIMSGLSFIFTQNRGNSSSLSGQFNADPAMSPALLDSLFLPDASNRLLKMAVNRVRNLTKNNGQQLSLNWDGRLFRKLGDNTWMTVQGQFAHAHSKSYSYALNHIDYLGDQPSTDIRNNYTQQPSNNYTLGGYYSISHRFGGPAQKMALDLHANYEYQQRYTSSSSLLYRLDRLEDYSEARYPLGVLPSSRALLDNVLDAPNGYIQGKHEYQHKFEPRITVINRQFSSKSNFTMTANLPVRYLTENLDYRNDKTYTKDRSSWIFEPRFYISYDKADSVSVRYIMLNYNSIVNQTDLVTLLGVHNDANPLFVTDGNPGLRNSRTHNIALYLSRFYSAQQRNLSLSTNVYLISDAIATRLTYDRSTGITHSRQENVNGNWGFFVRGDFTQPVDKKKLLTLDLTSTANYDNNVDLTNTTGTEESTKNKVRNLNLQESAKLEFKPTDKMTFTLNGSFNYRHATGTRKDFTNVSAYDFSYGGSVDFMFPGKVRLLTDLTQYSRRGYDNAAMNINELVWNVRVSRDFFKNKLTLAFDAFDVLGKLSNVQYTLNSQGHTEVWNNVIPRYAMLHVMYRFNFNGKKPKQQRRWYYY